MYLSTHSIGTRPDGARLNKQTISSSPTTLVECRTAKTLLKRSRRTSLQCTIQTGIRPTKYERSCSAFPIVLRTSTRKALTWLRTRARDRWKCNQDTCPAAASIAASRIVLPEPPCAASLSIGSRAERTCAPFDSCSGIGPSSASALRRSRWGPRQRRQRLGRPPSRVLSAGASPLTLLPSRAARRAARRLRGRTTAFRRPAAGPQRPAALRRASPTGTQGMLTPNAPRRRLQPAYVRQESSADAHGCRTSSTPQSPARPRTRQRVCSARLSVAGTVHARGAAQAARARRS